MMRTVSTPELNPVSYVVLGLVARDGPSTPYELKAAVARGIAGFWPFPHSQIYSEAARLAEAGLLTEEAESAGRRRRTYAITQDGQQALAGWLAEPSREPPQIRSLGLLQLYFGQFAQPEDRAALAAAQIEVHREVLGRYQEVSAALAARGDRPWQLRVAELGIAQVTAIITEWEQMPGVATTSRAGAGGPRWASLSSGGGTRG
jgi:PadR family transcriptional regulator, regulatory protein AphA